MPITFFFLIPYKPGHLSSNVNQTRGLDRQNIRYCAKKKKKRHKEFAFSLLKKKKKKHPFILNIIWFSAAQNMKKWSVEQRRLVI